MKKSIACVALSLVCAAHGLFAAISTPAATVNLTKTTVITTDDLNAKVKEYQDMYTQAGQDPTQVQPVQVLNVMINDELFRQGAARDGVNITDTDVTNQINSIQAQYLQQGATAEQFQDAVVSRYGSMDAYRSTIKDQMLVQQYLLLKKGDVLRSTPEVSDQEVQQVYNRYRTQFVQPENVKISHIFIPFDQNDDQGKDNANKALLDQVASDIKSGKITFEAAVSQYSQDDGSKDRAGDIGWLTRDDTSAVRMLGQDFVDEAFATPVGGTSDVIVSNQGYHIVKILAHGDPKFLALTDKIGPDSNATVADYIRQQLASQKQQDNIQKAENDMVEELRGQARIKVLYK